MLITNFASGELSPRLFGRQDLAQYYQGASQLVNFDVIPTGGIERRNGTKRVATLSGECRLIPFILDKDTSYILELHPNVMYFWKNGERLMSLTDSTVPLSMTIPWKSLSEIREVQYAQNYDTMIFCQQDAAPFMLVCTGSDVFTGSSMTFDFTPDVELDDDYDWITVVDAHDTKPAACTQSGYCIASGYLWMWDEDTAGWVIDTSVTEYPLDSDLFTAEGKYPAACAFFNGRLFFASTRNERQKIWASASPNLNGSRYNNFATYTKYVTVNKVITDPDIHYFTADTLAQKETTSTTTNGATTETTDWDSDTQSDTSRKLQLTNVTQDFTDGETMEGGVYTTIDLKYTENPYYVSGDVISVGTRIVAATWNPTTGKGTITLSSAILDGGEALVFSVQRWKTPTSASADDYEYKVVNNNITRSDNSFFFEVASDQNDAVKWLASSNHLVIGTESSCYVMSANSSASGQTVVMNGRHGTDDLQATVVDRAVIYFAQGKRGIREFYWNNDEEAFKSNDLALICPEMLSESAAVDFDFMTNPYARLLVTRYDGTLVSMLYEKNSGVMAWSRTVLGGSGKIRSLAVIRGDGGSDIIYFCVMRLQSDGTAAYFMEKLDMMPETHVIPEEKLYLDGRCAFDGSATGWDDGAVIYNATKGRVFTAGEYMKAQAALKHMLFVQGDDACIGWRFESLVKSMPVVNNDVSAKKRITKLLIRFYNSWKPVLKVEGRADETFTDFQEPFSGIKGIVYPGTSERDVFFTLSCSDIKPCTVLSVDAVLDS